MRAGLDIITDQPRRTIQTHEPPGGDSGTRYVFRSRIAVY